jgi:hypothetical protein
LTAASKQMRKSAVTKKKMGKRSKLKPFLEEKSKVRNKRIS